MFDNSLPSIHEIVTDLPLTIDKRMYYEFFLWIFLRRLVYNEFMRSDEILKQKLNDCLM